MQCPAPLETGNVARGYAALFVGTEALAFSPDGHDVPQRDIVRTSNRRLLILDAMRGLRTRMQSAAGAVQVVGAARAHAQLDGIRIKDLYRLTRVAFALNPDQIKNTDVPYSGGLDCLTPGAGRPACSATSVTTRLSNSLIRR